MMEPVQEQSSGHVAAESCFVEALLQARFCPSLERRMSEVAVWLSIATVASVAQALALLCFSFFLCMLRDALGDHA